MLHTAPIRTHTDSNADMCSMIALKKIPRLLVAIAVALRMLPTTHGEFLLRGYECCYLQATLSLA